MDESVGPGEDFSMQRLISCGTLKCSASFNLRQFMLAAAPHTLCHLVSGETTSSHCARPGTSSFWKRSRFPRRHATHPWGFSFIAQNSISYLRPMKITVQHQSPGLSFISSHSPSQCAQLHDISSNATCQHVPETGLCFGGEKCGTGRSFGAEGEGCSLGMSAGWLVVDSDAAVCRWTRGSFGLYLADKD